MNLFTWLLLGHFVADWLLQSDWMAIGKRRALFTLPGFAHYAVYTTVLLLILVLVAPHCRAPLTLLTNGMVIFISHWLIDGANVVQWWMRAAGQRDQTMVRVMVDQTFHLLVLGGVAAWCLASVG